MSGVNHHHYFTLESADLLLSQTGGQCVSQCCGTKQDLKDERALNLPRLFFPEIEV